LGIRNDHALSETKHPTARLAGENITRPSASSRVGSTDQDCTPAEDRRHGVIELLPCALRTATLCCCLLPMSSSSQLSIETCRSSCRSRVAERPLWGRGWARPNIKPTSGLWAVRACGWLLGCCCCAALSRSGPRIRPAICGARIGAAGPQRPGLQRGSTGRLTAAAPSRTCPR